MTAPHGIPDSMNGYQALAWVVWRTPKAVARFSGPNAKALWAATLHGKYPPGLGKPRLDPATAEAQMRHAMRTGQLRYEHVH